MILVKVALQPVDQGHDQEHNQHEDENPHKAHLRASAISFRTA
jgi:hypothetical protein